MRLFPKHWFCDHHYHFKGYELWEREPIKPCGTKRTPIYAEVFECCRCEEEDASISFSDTCVKKCLHKPRQGTDEVL